MKRVFIAINLPKEIKEEIWETFSKKIPDEGIKRVEKENLHVTVLFLGYLTEENINKLVKELKRIGNQKSFEAVLSGIGHFGSRVLWLGVTKNAERIAKIHDEICELLDVKENRFSAHVTIARNKRLSGREFFLALEKLRKESFARAFMVKTVDVMESILSSSGPTYKKLAEIRLVA